jgi:hypothetical protein
MIPMPVLPKVVNSQLAMKGAVLFSLIDLTVDTCVIVLVGIVLQPKAIMDRATAK